MEIFEYLDEKALTELCDSINMPKEVTNKVAEITDTYDFSQIAPFFCQLFNIETGVYKAISGILEENPQKGFIWLTIYLAAALETRKKYQDMGIEDKIFIDTFAIFSRITREHKASFGEYGYDRYFWNYRQVANVLYRLGELEFEMIKYPGEDLLLDNKTTIKKGDAVLSVHIPSDAKLSSQSCHKAYRQAIDFFAKYYPDFTYDYFYCMSWLLSPSLKDILPANSMILEFQKDFEFCTFNSEDTSYKFWVFNNKNDIEDFPENTSLQRNMKSYLQKGGKIGTAACVIDKSKLTEVKDNS